MWEVIPEREAQEFKLVHLNLRGLMSKINRKIFNGIPGMLHGSIYCVIDLLLGVCTSQNVNHELVMT